MPEDRKRQTLIVDALVDAFADLMDHDASAFRGKFRSMAADPWAFYRGSACVFSADMAETEDRWSDERTARIWIQGDLHAENFGTYMDGKGVLVIDVNDFDEAYLGSFTWDLRSFVDSDRDHDGALRLDTATGAVRTALQKAQLSTRVDLLEEKTVVEDYERRFRHGPGSRELGRRERRRVESAYAGYAYRRTTCSSRGTRRRWRTTSCCR